MDTDTTTPEEKQGIISRRAVIVGGAVGTAAFWSVPVIDSVVSRAAAGSIPCSGCTSATFTPSYGIVVFQQGTNIYAVQFNQGVAACALTNTIGGDIADGTVFASNCNGASYSKAGGGLARNGTLIPVFPGPGCPVSSSGNGVCVPNGSQASILFVFAHDGSFGSSHWKAFCPATTPTCSVSPITGS
jgi:hypothetical protein